MNSSATPTVNEPVNADPLYDASGAATYLGLVGVVKHPEQSVRSMCRKKQLRSTRVCGKVMVRRSWLEAYIACNTCELPV